MQQAERRVNAEQRVTLTNKVQLPFNPYMSLKSTTIQDVHKHPTNKRPAVSEMMMTFLFWGPANKQTYYRKWVWGWLFCSSNRLPRAAPLSLIHYTRLRKARVTDQLISTLKRYLLGFFFPGCCLYTGAVKELSQTLVVDKCFITHIAIKPGLDSSLVVRQRNFHLEITSPA